MEYPAMFEFNAPAKVGRWRIIGNWFLAIPHFIVGYVVVALGYVVAVLSWFAIVFTGKLPSGLAGFSCMVVRYQIRVSTYTIFMRSAYPPFDFDPSFQDNGNDPEVVVNVKPELEDRKRLSVLFRFVTLIPVAIVSIVWAIVDLFVVFFAFFAVLVLGRWPEGLCDLAVGVRRFSVRTNAYAALLTDKFPPLGLS